MKSTRTTTVVEKEKTVKATNVPLFERENIIWMLAGAAVMIIGFLLMSGGRSTDPKVFDEKEVYSTTRITIAPIVILLGLAIEIFAIFRHPKK
jgi:hypothetical protein